MIGKIKGTLVEMYQTQGLIETTGGVFYSVHLPASLIPLNLPKEIEVYTYLHVREDALVLFGFESRTQMDLFHMLHSISGVGPKTAFNILSFIEPVGMMKALHENDISYFTKIPGLGKKTAMKIVLELSQKMDQEVSLSKLKLNEDDETVLSGLTSLGFPAQDVRKILPQLAEQTTLEDKIMKGIQLMTQKK